MNFCFIDGNSIGYMAHNALFTPLTRSSDGMQVQAIYGFFNRLSRFIDMHPEYTPIVLWDGFTEWRQDLLPEYKANRSDTEEKRSRKQAYKDQRPQISKMLSFLGVPQVTAPKMEADDLAAVFSTLCDQNGDKVLLLSSDQDWLQLITKNVSWEEGRSNKDKKNPYRVVNVDNFQEFTGYPTIEAFVGGMSIAGDASDGISGVPGFGDKTCIKVLEKYSNVEELLTDLKHNSFDSKNTKLVTLSQPENIKTIERNYQLVSLLGLSEFDGDVVVSRQDFSREDLLAFFQEFEFKKFFSEINSIQDKFKKIDYSNMGHIINITEGLPVNNTNKPLKI